MERAADRAHERLEKLDSRLKADAVTDYRRSVVQTLIGTFVGLIGGYMASWVDKGGALFPDGTLSRVAIATGAGLAFVVVAPVLIFPRVDRLLGKLGDLREKRRPDNAPTP